MLVRHSYSDEAVWRETLGGTEPLYPFALHGFCIDAPDHIPAGSTVGYTYNRIIYINQSTYDRSGIYQ